MYCLEDNFVPQVKEVADIKSELIDKWWHFNVVVDGLVHNDVVYFLDGKKLLE